MLKCIIIGLMLASNGCVADQVDDLVNLSASCESKGFQPGTPEMEKCMTDGFYGNEEEKETTTKPAPELEKKERLCCLK